MQAWRNRRYGALIGQMSFRAFSYAVVRGSLGQGVPAEQYRIFEEICANEAWKWLVDLTTSIFREADLPGDRIPDRPKGDIAAAAALRLGKDDRCIARGSAAGIIPHIGDHHRRGAMNSIRSGVKKLTVGGRSLPDARAVEPISWLHVSRQVVIENTSSMRDRMIENDRIANKAA